MVAEISVLLTYYFSLFVIVQESVLFHK